MTIRCIGTNKSITEAMILEASVGSICDTYKEPLELIHLEWSPLKKGRHYGKTKGFEDTFIKRLRTGGLQIYHRKPGSAMWLRDQLSGKYTATLARTDHNMRMLASMYYDKLWTIREKHIDALVKAEADKIDAELAQNKVSFYIDEPVLNEKGHIVDFKQVEKVQSELEFHKERREGHFQNRSTSVRQSSIKSMRVEEAHKAEKDEIAKQKAEIEREKQRLADKEARLNEAKALLSQTIAPVETASLSTEYTREQLETLNPISKLRSIAKEFKTDKTVATMTKTALIDEILECQKRVIEEEETEVVSS